MLRFRVLAEREGFEPPVPLSTTVFKTVVIDHSTISPDVGMTCWCSKASAKIMLFLFTSKFFMHFLMVIPIPMNHYSSVYETT